MLSFFSTFSLECLYCKPPLQEQIRYTFYSQTIGLIQETSLPRILSTATQQSEPGVDGPNVFSDLLKDGCFWIDILDPSDLDMQICAKVIIKAKRQFVILGFHYGTVSRDSQRILF